MSWLRNPWARPRGLVIVTVLYILWSIVPVAIAILFAFNNGRSRTSWQGFSFRWYTGSAGSVLHDPALQGALKHTLILAVICVGIATPLGVALALGLQRWRGPGGGTINTVMLLPLVTPEIVMGVALLLLFLRVFPGIGLGTPAPAIVASAAVAFALSIDDFVVTQYLAGDSSTTTVSMLLYASARGAPTPALNALATVALVITMATLALALLVYRRFAGGREAAAVATLEV
jgi:spermidine/putrescine transport system permease protein